MPEVWSVVLGRVQVSTAPRGRQHTVLRLGWQRAGAELGETLMWCVGYRVIRFQGPEMDGKRLVGERHRVVDQLGMRVLADTLRGKPMVFLPEAAGAGPCGTDARRIAGRKPLGESSIAWFVMHMWSPIALYYLSRGPQPPKELGARTGPRGRPPAPA